MISRALVGWFVGSAACGAATLLAHDAQAQQCIDTAISASDQAFADTLPKNPLGLPECPEDYMRFATGEWLYAEGSWEGRGLLDACNTRLQFAKHWTSTFVVENGIAFETVAGAPGGGPVVLLDRAFHPGWEYRMVGRGKSGIRESFCTKSCTSKGYHVYTFLHYAADYRGTVVAAWKPQLSFADDRLTTYCPFYDPNDSQLGGTWSSISQRAGALIHEGWHAHYRGFDFNDHKTTVNAFCDGSCDNYYPHPKASFPEGELWMAYPDSRPISVYQLQHEFLCDLADRPQAWVPNAIREDAAIGANTVATIKFVNGPAPFTCGLPTPFAGSIVPTRPSFLCGASTFCQSDGDCDAGSTCNAGCCGAPPDDTCTAQGDGPACSAPTDCTAPFNACGSNGCCTIIF